MVNADTLMSTRKSEIRGIVLDLIAGRERSQYGAGSFSGIFSGVAEVIERRKNKPKDSFGMFSHPPSLDGDDKLLASEVIWDLLFERVLTPGMDASNLDLPWVRVHSEVQERLDSLA